MFSSLPLVVITLSIVTTCSGVFLNNNNCKINIFTHSLASKGVMWCYWCNNCESSSLTAAEFVLCPSQSDMYCVVSWFSAVLFSTTVIDYFRIESVCEQHLLSILLSPVCAGQCHDDKWGSSGRLLLSHARMQSLPIGRRLEGTNNICNTDRSVFY